MLSAESREALIEAAIQAREYAYFPQSNFRVGAALICTDGTIVKGASIDNASYGASTCAEQTAIVKAISEGKREFSGLAIVSDVIKPISPCGICRQVIREFCHVDMPVLLVPGDYPRSGDSREDVNGGGVIEETVGTLLPRSFGPTELENVRLDGFVRGREE
ncbi:cytidine deaminase [Boletus edulis]|nr:cytidine deaminase [Boletus edulis]